MSNDHSNAKDFFLHAGFIVSLYASVIAFVTLLFRIINIAFPTIDAYYGWSASGSPLSMPVATLIVAFPLFIFFSRIVYNSYVADPIKKEFWIRKWLLYITLFIAGIVLAGDLVTVIYYFIDGRELSAGFLLKALVLLIVAGGVFGYYLKDLREGVSAKFRKQSAIVVTLVVVISIVLGFLTIGSPRTQRLMRYDEQKVMTLQTIEGDIRSYIHSTGRLPESLDALYKSIYVYGRPDLQQPDSGEPYTYRILEENVFELCATFNISNHNNTRADRNIPVQREGRWSYDAGFVCFEIDATDTEMLNKTGPRIPIAEPF